MMHVTGHRARHRRSKADKVAFAVHAFFMADGYKLVALGDAAELPGALAAAAAPSHPATAAPITLCALHAPSCLRGPAAPPPRPAASQDAPEVPADGWNASQEQYAFAYLPEQAGARQAGLLVRALAAGDLLLVSVLSGAPGAEPRSAELQLERFAGPDAGGYVYQELQALVGALLALLPGKVGAGAAGWGAGPPPAAEGPAAGPAVRVVGACCAPPAAPIEHPAPACTRLAGRQGRRRRRCRCPGQPGGSWAAGRGPGGRGRGRGPGRAEGGACAAGWRGLHAAWPRRRRGHVAARDGRGGR
jgi:hypothetical protein